MIAEPELTFVVGPEREAHEPPEARGVPRDHVLLLVSDRSSGTIAHAQFTDIADFLRPGDLVVVNDSATIPAALEGRRNDGEAVTVHLSSRVTGTLWIAEPRAAVSEGEHVLLPHGGSATFLAPVANGQRLWYVRLDVPEPADEYLAAWGKPIRYGYVTGTFPLSAYQTIFASVPGSAEMPSAGRPFSQRVRNELTRRGVEIAAVTLHCGVSSVEAHERPPAEPFSISPHAAARINAARRDGRRVIAVGTTVVRALESAADEEGWIVATRGWTDLVVTGERGVRVVQGLLTGLHEPHASHLDLLAAFLDRAELKRAYDAALARGYLWHEFGDVHLIL